MLKRCEVGEALHKAIGEDRGGQLLASGTWHHFVVECVSPIWCPHLLLTL